jgi:hypothetical protein
MVSYFRVFKERCQSAIEAKRLRNELVRHHIIQRSAASLKRVFLLCNTFEQSNGAWGSHSAAPPASRDPFPTLYPYFIRMRETLLAKRLRRSDIASRLQNRYDVEKKSFFRRLRIMMNDAAMREKVLVKLLLLRFYRWKEAYVRTRHAMRAKKIIFREFNRQRAINRVRSIIQRRLVHDLNAAFARWRAQTNRWKTIVEQIESKRYLRSVRYFFNSWRNIRLADIFHRTSREFSCRHAFLSKLLSRVRLRSRSEAVADNHILRRNRTKAQVSFHFWRECILRSLRLRRKAYCHNQRLSLRLGWIAISSSIKRRRNQKALRVASTAIWSGAYLQSNRASSLRSETPAASASLPSNQRPSLLLGPYRQTSARRNRAVIDPQYKHLLSYVSKSPILKHLYFELNLAQVGDKIPDLSSGDLERYAGMTCAEHRALVAVALDRGTSQSWGFQTLLYRCSVTSYMRTTQSRMHMRFLLGRYLQFMHRTQSQKSLLSIAESFHYVMKLRKTLRLWNRRVRINSKLRRREAYADDFFGHQRCALAFVLWYSMSR